MAPPNKFSSMLHRRTNRITRVLIYAFLEWTLIFLLLINSLFSYFILKFALYFGLKPPCFLCSRIDHFLDSHKNDKNKKTKFSPYSEIICEQHAAEISKIGYCSHHRKLVELHDLCESCSAAPSDDPEVSKWMAEIGIVKDEDDDATKKCSCCERVLIKVNPISKVSSSDFVIKDRELLGDFLSDQNVQIGSDQSDDQAKFGYQILDDGDEEDKEENEVVFEAEKEPLLNNTNGNKGEIEEIVRVTTQNLCPDMLPQHLDFYIDHDDYRLIPVEFINDDSIKVESKSAEISRNFEGRKETSSGFSREFELVFEGDELVLPGCEVTNTAKDLPSIQEEEELVIEKVQIHKEEEKMESSDKFELVFEGNELVTAGIETEILNLPKDEEQMKGSDKFEQVFEGNDLLSGFEYGNLQSPAVDKMQDSDKFELVFKENELVAGSEYENSPIPESEENMKNSEISPVAYEGDEIISENSPTDEEESVAEKLQVRENEEEEDSQLSQSVPKQEKEREIEISFLSEEKEETATIESTPILDVQERNNQAVQADSQVTAVSLETPSTSSDSKEDNASYLMTDETDIEEKNQNPTEKLLFQEYEANLASLFRSYEIETETNQNSTDELLVQVDEPPTASKQETHTLTDNVVCHDDEICERSLNANVSMSHDEVEEDKVPDTPTSSESLHKKLLLLGRRESATEESLDGMSTISEHGETMEKLKVDLLTERKTLRALYKELEEERNASAIAANQTMAMITRLQEEKATMQLEASQYQRMMEEQSEYDQEALQMMNELVVKREKEKQELEKELEVYRKKVMEYEEKERMRIMCRRRSRNSSASCSYGEESDGQSIDYNHEVKDQEEDVGISPHYQAENGHQDTPTDAVLCLQDSLAGFEEERQAILEQLKVLEEKLFTLAEEEEEHFENMKPFEQFYEENGKDFDIDNRGDNNEFIHVNGKHQQDRRINDSMPKKLLLPLFDAAESLDSPNGVLNGNEDEFHITKFELEKKRFAVEEEVDHVYERLQALEADREFLKHCIGSLRKGDKGLDLLQEILQHLRDLKNVEVQAMKNTDHCASV
ncbi:myosin-binding protein 3-like [Chenopodium quinoa]|uniref:myosin-binding protein 3-like n=1 Tax=Chenopodium quinoa TaxID=63459 RepID=UPI000B7803C7|nr:myosin-binding protein 3-like [Chenopodium quinoa]